MSKRALVYDESGRVLEVRTAPPAYFEEVMADTTWIAIDDDTWDDANSFVDLSGDNPEVRERVPLAVSVLHQGLSVRLQGLPAGCRVEVMGAEVEADDEGVELEFDAPGTYSISLYPPPQFTDEIVEVTVG